jgi:glutamine synthetase
MVKVMDEQVKKAIETLKTNNIRWVHSAFVDVRGILQDMVLPAREYLSGVAFTEGVGFDGSSVRGFKSIEESDMIFMPDAKTLAIMPWVTEEGQKSVIILGDSFEAFGGKEASVTCPRGYVAKRAIKAAKDMGYTGIFAPELEHFVFTSIDPTKLTWDLWAAPKSGEGDAWGAPRVVPNSPEITPGGYVMRPKEGYYRTPPEDTTVAYRNEVSQILEDYFGLTIEKHHHEVATVGQVEIDYNTANS